MQRITAAIYVRQSQDRDGTGLGVARQEQECLARAAALGWPVVEVYTDNDVSATKRVARPAYARLLADLEAGARNAVVVWDLDRLHRRPVELEQFIDLADRLHIKLASVGGDVDLGTDNGRLYARIKGAVAASEGERKAARIRAKNDQAAALGMYIQECFGYTGLDVVPDEAALIKAGFDAVIRGESLSSVTASFNASGIKPRRAREWTRKAVRDVLTRPRYAGRTVLRGQETGQDGPWAPIVTLDTLRAAQAVLSSPERKTTPGPTRRLLLSGLVTCGKCGEENFGGGMHTRPGVPVRLQYRCNTCRGVTVGRELAEAVVIDRLCYDLSTNEAGAWTRHGNADHLDRIREVRVRLGEIADEERQVAEAPVAVHLKLAMGKALNDERTGLEAEVARLTQQDAITSLILDLSATPKYVTYEADEPTSGDWINAYDVRVRFEAMPLERRQAVLRALYTITALPSNRGRDEASQRARIKVESKS